MRVPFANLKIEDPNIHTAVVEVLKSGQFIQGQVVERFESDWAEFCGAKFCVATSSGSSALTAALKMALEPGARVLLPEYSFAATLFSVLEAGLRPVFCRITPSGLIDQSDVYEKLCREPGPCGVLVVHLYGQVVELWPRILNHPRAVVIEDACQAHGTKLQGLAACFSFYPSKNLGAAGDAGAVVTNSNKLAYDVYRMCNYGDPRGTKYQHTMMGTNARMDAIQAAILWIKLADLPEGNAARSLQASFYRNVITPVATAAENYHHLFPIMVDPLQILKIQSRLRDYGIEVGRHYPYTLPALYTGLRDTASWAHRLASTVLTLPIGPHLTNEQLLYVVRTVDDLLTQVEGIYQLREEG